MKWKKEYSIILALSLVVLVLVVAGAAILWPREEAQTATSNGTQYDANVILEDPETLQDMVDKMLAKASEGQMALEMQVTAYSQDGTNFTCYLANALENNYDMYMILTLDEGQEELCRTGLIPVGGHLENLTLQKELSSGTYTCTLSFVQVEEDGETVHAEVNVGFELIVSD